MKDKKELLVLTVCGAGVGTSALLRATIDSVFSSLNLPFYVRIENTGLNRAKTLKADVIYTFETFSHDAEEFGVDVIVIDNLMDTAEIKRKTIDYLKKKELI